MSTLSRTGPLSVLAACLLLQAAPSSGTPAGAGTWNRYLDFVDEQVRAIHPDPWRRIPERDFERQVERLRRDLPALHEGGRVVRTMQLVARLRDGHTRFDPTRCAGFGTWFPVRLDRFADGIFVTVTDSSNADCLTARVLGIGALTAEDAYQRVASVIAVDSDHALPRLFPGYVANAGILRGLGVIGADDSLQLRLATSGGTIRTVALAAIRWSGYLSWPVGQHPMLETAGARHPFQGLPAPLPLHLRRRLSDIPNYWFEPIPERRALYVQFNAVSDAEDEPLDRFTRRLWAYCEQHADSLRRIVLDLRYNEGGNGYLLDPFIQEFIRHPALTRRGALYALIGPGTFSAAVSCLAGLIKHTQIVTVGEPTAGPLNWCSDTNVMRIPSTDLRLIVSRYCWQGGNPWDRRGFYPPEVPAPVTSGEYFAGRDRALELALSDSTRTLLDVLRGQGASAMAVEYENRRRSLPQCDWVYPYTEYELRNAVYRDLMPAGRLDDALAATRFNLTLHPKSSELWADLAEIAAEKGEKRLALEYFEKALEFNPHRAYLQGKRDRLREELGGNPGR
jgi:hypothetical protein